MGNVINHIKLCKLHKEIGHVDSNGASQSLNSLSVAMHVLYVQLLGTPNEAQPIRTL